MTTKIQATTITLTRAEGMIHECMTLTVSATDVRNELGDRVGDFIATTDVWRRANAVLAAWSRTAPRSGGYDKCDFRVTYADGDTYDGRYDLKAIAADGYPSIERHMFRHCECSSGRQKPAHATREQWDAYLRDVLGDKGMREYASFLDTYAIGNLNDAPTSGPNPIACPCGTGQCRECDDNGMIEACG